MSEPPLTADDWTLIRHVAVVCKPGKLFPWWRIISVQTGLSVDAVRQSVEHLIELGFLLHESDGYRIMEALFDIEKERIK